MSANQYIVDALTRHQIFLERFGGGQWRKIKPILVQLKKDVDAAIRAGDLTADQAIRAELVIRDLNTIISEANAAVNQQLTADMTDLYAYEAGFSERLLGGVANVQLAGVSVETAAAIVTTARFALVSGKDVDPQTIAQMIRTFDRSVQNDVAAVIRSGILQGQTTQQIAASVARLTETRTYQHAEALTRTVTAAVASEARSKVHAANADLLEGEKWIATLDSRTTIGCAALDGRIFPLGSGPTAPRHYRCRSVRVPVIRAQYAVPRFEGQRASVDGPEPGSTTYGGWLKRQSAEFQDEVLGPERAALFRSGKVSIGNFADDRGVVYTLDELKQREGLTV